MVSHLCDRLPNAGNTVAKAHLKIGQFPLLATQEEGEDSLEQGTEGGIEPLVSSDVFEVFNPDPSSHSAYLTVDRCIRGGLRSPPAAQ